MAEQTQQQRSLAGVWVADNGRAHLTYCDRNNARELSEEPVPFFCWAADNPGVQAGEKSEALKGSGFLNYLRFFKTAQGLKDFVSEHGKQGRALWLRAAESQYLMQNGLRLFEGMHFSQLRRLQVDIETFSERAGEFPNPRNAGDRVLAIGLNDGRGDILLELDAMTDEAERALLEKFSTHLLDFDPDVIEGHNIFKFDLDYLRQRCKRLKLPCVWGRYGQPAAFRNSRLKIAERTLDFPRCDLPGRTVFDTYLALQLYDIFNRDLPSYSLKAAAKHFGFTTQKDERTYLAPADIQRTFFEDRKTFRAYLKDDLRETRALAEFLLPTYFAQAKGLPMSLQEICLRGTAQKIETLFLEKYFAARESLPAIPEVGFIEGGYTASIKTGVFHDVLHFDVASMYPSLLLSMDRNPKGDSLGVFIPLLKQLRQERLEFKKLSRTGPENLRAEYAARQGSYKILINSFYGYLAFGGARFADSELAAEVTRRGRELLQSLIAAFEKIGVDVLEADTDGLYVQVDKKWFKDSQELLEKVLHLLPEGIELEHDGSYESMWSYKAKNYALYDGNKVTLRGSALRSRAMEPFLKTLTDTLIESLLGVSKADVCDTLNVMRAEISDGKMPVEQLVKTEFLNARPETYLAEVEKGKPRRAALEVALQMGKMPKLGERVSYYISKGAKARMPDWQVARPLETYDKQTAPYDPAYYLRKLDDWQKRYGEFFEKPCDDTPAQGDLF